MRKTDKFDLFIRLEDTESIITISRLYEDGRKDFLKTIDVSAIHGRSGKEKFKELSRIIREDIIFLIRDFYERFGF